MGRGGGWHGAWRCREPEPLSCRVPPLLLAPQSTAATRPASSASPAPFAAIFLLIAGTNTPLCLIALPPAEVRLSGWRYV